MIFRFVPFQKYMAAENMAIDEAMMCSVKENLVPATLRFYGWKLPTLSIGYFQSVKEVNVKQIKQKGFEWIRRITGGRAVLHEDELTYSLVAPEAYFPTSIVEAHAMISQGIQQGFRNLGIEAILSSPTKREEGASSACFDTTSDYEPLVQGRKIAGSAQVRKQGVLLQHGSIPIQMNPDHVMDVLSFPSDRVKERYRKHFMNRVISVNDALPTPVAINQVIEAFYQGFQKGLGVDLVEGELSAKEKKDAMNLVESRYGTKEWNRSR